MLRFAGAGVDGRVKLIVISLDKNWLCCRVVELLVGDRCFLMYVITCTFQQPPKDCTADTARLV